MRSCPICDNTRLEERMTPEGIFIRCLDTACAMFRICIPIEEWENRPEVKRLERRLMCAEGLIEEMKKECHWYVTPQNVEDAERAWEKYRQ